MNPRLLATPSVRQAWSHYCVQGQLVPAQLLWHRYTITDPTGSTLIQTYVARQHHVCRWLISQPRLGEAVSMEELVQVGMMAQLEEDYPTVDQIRHRIRELNHTVDAIGPASPHTGE